MREELFAGQAPEAAIGVFVSLAGFVRLPTELITTSLTRSKTASSASGAFRSLRKTGDSFRKIIVTGDYQDPWKDDAGVMHIGVIPFLLDKTLLEK